MADDADSKTEQPTQRRLTKAHDEGEVLQSHEVKTAAIILSALILVWAMANPLLGRAERILYTFFARADAIRLDTVDGFTRFMTDTFMQIALLMAAPFAMFVIVAIAATVMQT